MKKIPFWDSHPKSILLNQDQSNLTCSTSSFSYSPTHHILPLYTLQMSVIFIDHNFQILSNLTHCQENDRESCSIVHNKINSRIAKLTYCIHACGCIGQEYWLVVQDQNCRYDVLVCDASELCQVLELYEDNHSQYEKQQDTQLKPLKKLKPAFTIHQKILYLTGSKPIHQWQLTSPIWSYSLLNHKWKQLDYYPNKDNFKSKDKKNNQRLTTKTIKQWLIPLQDVMIIITSEKISAQVIKTIKLLKDCWDVPVTIDGQYKIIGSPIIQPQHDSFVYCNYTNSQNCPSLLLLVKTNTAERPPLLLQISLIQMGFIRETSNNTSIQNKIKKNNSTDYKITVIYRNIGIFLCTNINHTPCKLWDVINEIVYMQVTQQRFNPTLLTMNSTTNFIKKHYENLRQSTKYKKTLMLNLYTKTIKNSGNNTNSNGLWSSNSTCIVLNTHSIKLNLLENLSIGGGNIPLSRYFQDKEYSDMVIIAQRRQILCSKHLFQFYSPKFKKLFANSSKTKIQGPTMVKLQHTKLSTAYFLVQQLYHQFAIPLSTIDQLALLDIMVLAQKFQIISLQILCQQEIVFEPDNFTKLYDYFRNSETPIFREELLKCFIMQPQAIIKNMPIGKVQQLIRLIYSPQCAHTNLVQLKAKLQNTYSLKYYQTNETKQINKSINYAGIIKGQQIIIKICLKCNRVLGFKNQSHRKNKSTVRGNSVGSFGHKKKDNNSN